LPLLKTFLASRWLHPLLLVVWIVIGAVLRFTQLTGKPPWTDEFATLVFTLGNSFQTVPVDQAISLDTLLQPLQLNPEAGASAVLHHLITEDHHPPLYFVLVHWWMQLFPASGEYVSLWAARSLPALFGVASIPAAYGLGFLAFRGTRSHLVGHLAAAMIAVSPYGVFLSQEARHYTLGILWVIASLCCFVVAIQHFQRRVPLPIGVALGWITVNSLGIATHYFFCLTLGAEAIVLMGFWMLGSRFAQKLAKHLTTSHSPLPTPPSYWWRIGAVAVGTLVGCLVWVPVWQAGASEQMTGWIMRGNFTILTLINPIFQALATWITMLCLLPVESPELLVMIASGVVMLVYFIWAVPILYHGLKVQLEQPDSRLAIGALGGFVLGAIAIIFSITYFLGADLTRGARYNFVYFPAVPVLLGAALAVSWNASNTLNSYQVAIKGITPSASPASPTSRFSPSTIKGKPAVTLIWLVGLLSGITIVSNLGYRKYYRPDLLVPTIQQRSSVPILIATTHNTLVQTGEMMGLAWEFKRIANAKESRLKPQFLLAHQAQDECVSSQRTACPASTTLKQTLAQLPRPLDLWLVNFKASVQPDLPNCFAEDTSGYQTNVNGYSSRLYHCLSDNSEASQRL
jgi:uncharacterized membrane protein